MTTVLQRSGERVETLVSPPKRPEHIVAVLICAIRDSVSISNSNGSLADGFTCGDNDCIGNQQRSGAFDDALDMSQWNAQLLLNPEQVGVEADALVSDVHPPVHQHAALDCAAIV